MMRRLCALSVGLCSSVSGSLAAQTTITLEQVLSAPFATELVAAPAGGLVAWVQNIRGARNIWVAEPPQYRGRQVTRYDSDDGQRVAQLALAPNATTIVFVRGGEEVGARMPYAPNPGNVPTGVREEIWTVSTSGGVPARIDEGRLPALSPRGDLVAYIKQGQIWTAPLSSGSPDASGPRLLIADRGNPTTLRWSPAGDRLAFVSQRGSHSFIGVYELASRSLTYVDPSIDRDREPTWSPDGTRLAFIREAATAGELPYEPRREAYPWSIRVADVATGAGREVWRASPGPGSAFWNLLSNERQLFWGAGDRLVFPWERTGWLHLYSVSVNGGEPTQLTSGEFEVEHTTLSPDRREIIFASSQGDLNRRHLWRVAVATGPPRALTSGNGIEYWPVVTSDGGAVAFLASGGKVSPQAEILRIASPASSEPGRSARTQLAPGVAPKDFPSHALVEPQAVVFSATDGLKVHGQLFVPPTLGTNTRSPAMLYLHGGPRAQMVLGYHYHRLDYYQKMYGLIQYLVMQGYVVLSVNYRSGTGYGMAFREAEQYGGGGASQVRDVVGAGLYLQTLPYVDPKRIGIWGGSYGGYLTAMGLGQASQLFAAGVDIHGVHSFDVNVQLSPYRWADEDAVRRLARQSSPISFVDQWRSPVLFIHGDDDRNVQFTQTVALASELRRRGVHVEQLVIPNEVHSFLLHESWVRALRAAADFFDRKLKRSAASVTSSRSNRP